MTPLVLGIYRTYILTSVEKFRYQPEHAASFESIINQSIIQGCEGKKGVLWAKE